ncbi:hypothetical protein HBH56_152860 [Parastagonospora nodorum]|uniref:Fungal-type protein kinase domain-containing protein n=1 Tax=Phaeosphaeria nodorum (strain SN15 / ATCC MYA-4574 / FGSC 10173) TaxID=321614 RepID=A0A7U2EZN6_PHANO|nr:hypothetical protein HBH56_152860 [Parastagonospora nodorum]QRC96053.1 hypothetical protein JI435_056930 [Parastagonospora nodorum SN15]KAH3926505.1 hypothetical protein HBH54_164830 [Parastagonospora nodorum]KAH3940425.1 hypothetical protein HBH53_217770 [Parastagonospora nodorum]KAH3970364.1 hypothetical protein HBH52_166060 [Parastagonospora nodorum]
MSKTIEYKSVKPSGETTKLTIAPKVLVCYDAEELIRIANTALQDPNIADSRLKDSTITSPGGPGGAFDGDSEGNIVKASLAYILLPIYEILNILYYGKFKMSTEFSHKLPVELLGDEVEDGEEKQPRESVLRTDEIFVVSQGQPDAGKTICVIEYKRRKLLRYKDWRKAMLPPDYTDKQYGRVMKDSQGKTRSALEQNALSCTKQVAAYASRTKCKHAAILNWDHALFFEFNKLVGALKNSAGEEANLIWATEDMEFKEKYVTHDFLRKVMLGWTLRAFKDRFGY